MSTTANKVVGPTRRQSLHQTLARFEAARVNARRFHKAEVGDVDPDFCLGDFCSRIYRNDRAGLEKHYGSFRGTEKAALAETSGTTGGYTVPVELQYSILEAVVEQSIFRPRAFVQPLNTAVLQMSVFNATTVQSAGVSPFFGGMSFTWTPEAATLTEAEPTFDQIELHPWNLTGYIVASVPLVEDGGAPLDTHLRRLFGLGIAWFEDYAFFRGDGVGKPLGIVTAPGSKQVTRQTANQISLPDVAALMQGLLPFSIGHACWACSPTALNPLLQLRDPGGRTIWVANEEPGAAGGIGFLMGMPVYVTEKLPPLGTAGDLVLFDPRLYVIADRMGGMEIEYSPHPRFLTYQGVFRVLNRVDGVPWLSNTVTLQDGTTVVSGYVILN